VLYSYAQVGVFSPVRLKSRDIILGGVMDSWNDSLLIGVKLIDEQHHELVRRMDRLVDACRRGEGQAEVGKTMKFVVSYIKEHFKDEEELQLLYEYPDRAAHKKLHDHFVETTIDLMQELKEGHSADFTEKARKLLIGWFLMHINNEDKKVAAFIHAHGGMMFTK